MKQYVSATSAHEAVLADIIDEITEELQAGRAIDLVEIVKRCPDMAEQIHGLLPALELLADLKRKDPHVGARDDAQVNNSEPEEPALPCSKTIGDYRLIAEIGRGGMGVVYEAKQISLGRRVALKVLPFAGALDYRQLQRFKNEAQAAALLHHQNIVPVHGIGSDRGVHFYAMQYIEGQTLADVINDLRVTEGRDGEIAATGKMSLSRNRPDDNRQRSSRDDLGIDHLASRSATPTAPSPAAETARTPQAKLSTEGSTKSVEYFRSIAETGIQVAEALEHAHEEGVVHRDIKPSNLIVDHRGKAWVTDFGLALVQADPGLTMTGDIVGTLRYMSPEQALGKRVIVDQRTDVYSLCATLYEMLTLEPVFSGCDRHELIRQIAFEDPRRPTKLNRALPLELETIIVKGLEKNPEDRYDSARQLADDLRRFLEDKPIHARPPSLPQRTAKWARRHKSVVASAAVVLILATIGLAVGSLLLAQQRNLAENARESEQRQREEAERQRDEAERQKALAQQNFRRAREAVDEYLTNVSENRLLNAPSLQPLRRDLLELALKYYQEFIAERGVDPDVRREAGRAYLRAGEVLAMLNQHEEAHRADRKAIELFDKLVAEEPGKPDNVHYLAESYLQLGNLLGTLGRLAEQEQAYRQAVATQKLLVTELPHEPRYSDQLAMCYSALASATLARGQVEQAAELYQQGKTQ